MKIWNKAVFGFMALAFLLTVVGCKKEPEGPAEKAGKQLDKAVEQAGQEVGKALEQTGEAMKEAGEKVKEGSSQ